MSVNVDKMRSQAQRIRTGGRCGARYKHSPGLPIEVCTLREGHSELHDWPSLVDTDPRIRGIKIGQSAIRMAGIDMADMIARAAEKRNS